MDINELVVRYLDSWHETDPERRRALIERVWAADGTYVDPAASVAGHAAIDGMIAAFQERFGGQRFRLIGPIDGHHDRVRFSWALALQNGPPTITGVDFGVIADGRLQAISGFFDRPAAAGVLETERLRLRKATADDAPFILELLNDPAFIRFIGDRKVRTLDDARGYIASRLVDSYERNGFGLWVVEPKAGGGEALGLCGLVKRDTLADVDIGYAFLPRFRAKGYASEAAAGVLRYGMRELGLGRLVGITDPDNHGSVGVLEKIGLIFERMVRLSDDDIELKLFATPG